MAAIPIERFSTATARPAARLAYWNELLCETFNNLAVDPDDPVAFHGELVRAPIGPISMMSADSAPAFVNRLSDPWRDARDTRSFHLHYQLAGRSLNTQMGREAVLETGDFTLCDASQPYSVRFTERNHMLCLKIPAEALIARLSDMDGVICMPMSACRGAGAMLSSVLCTAWNQLDALGDEDWGDAVSGVILDLLELAYRPLSGSGVVPSAQAQWRQKARAFIDERLCDPELGAASIAQALGLSPRYVQMLFSAQATTPSAYILERRLRLAAERLRRTDECGITEVAMAVGFNDLTHFGRAFRRRFGVAPRDYRSGVRAPRWAAPSSLEGAAAAVTAKVVNETAYPA